MCLSLPATSLHLSRWSANRQKGRTNLQPRVFISYSWSSPGHQERVRQWAEQLVEDGIDVVFDLWSFKEGDDKFVFMESMVVDETITNVLIFSDERYSEKADAREAGVGAESQIISRPD
ncbi:SEFIR domain-containing protein [Xanthomonas axonopodis]|uniref:SEFIR domain-containing protein n=1 Tax=Xanthomonas axonopodis TaxID=53413 RepID=UPI003CCE8E16